MILEKALELMDLLLDKADQPYFTTEEKKEFLSLAISDFININYQRMQTDEDARRALSGCVDNHFYEFTDVDLSFGGATYFDSSIRAPGLSIKYPESGGTDITGYWMDENNYALPKQHLYVLSLIVTYYDFDNVIDIVTGYPKAQAGPQDVIFYPPVEAKNKSIRQFNEDKISEDPFNGISRLSDYNHFNNNLIYQSNRGAQWAYSENKIIIEPSRNIAKVDMETITLPTVDEAFSGDVRGVSGSSVELVFAEHYQRQIVELAVSKMTKVDIGLMTPSSQ